MEGTGMFRLRIGFVAAALVSNTVADENVREKPVLRVCVIDSTHLSTDTLAGAKQRARGIFRAAGIAIRWTGDQPGTCNPPSRGAVVIRVAPAAPKSLRLPVAAETVIQPEQTGGYVTVFRDRLDGLRREIESRRSQIMLPDLLGVILSHEIGHALMRRSSHSEHGVMRARWDLSTFRTIETIVTIHFERSEAMLMRQAILDTGRPTFFRSGSGRRVSTESPE
jgi:hypothetical protein